MSDPNYVDDEEYIVHLVGKVVMVSVESLRQGNELTQAVKAVFLLTQGTRTILLLLHRDWLEYQISIVNLVTLLCALFRVDLTEPK